MVELGSCSIALIGEFTRSFFLLPVPTVNAIVESRPSMYTVFNMAVSGVYLSVNRGMGCLDWFFLYEVWLPVPLSHCGKSRDPLLLQFPIWAQSVIMKRQVLVFPDGLPVPYA